MAELYEIVSQEESTDLFGGGRVAQVMVITFRTKQSGVTAMVRIPLDRYTSDYVKSAIEAKVNIIEAVHNL